MVARRWVAVVLLGALASLGAQFRTTNFVVEASTPQIAQRIGEWAEYYRRDKALQWLGKEMPNWGQPCPLKVTVTYNGSGGATSFAFDRGRILSIDMNIEGTLDRLVASVLPHEVTHTVLAHHFRCPVPRWADEGGSVLSEDEQERSRHDTLVRQILNTPGRAIPLRRLFTLTQYPRDVMVLYAEGYSVTNFLVSKSSRGHFLNFLADGMRQGWDTAVATHYGYRTVDELEQAWMQHLRENRRPPTTLASAGNTRPVADGTAMNRVVVRQTLPPAMPVLQRLVAGRPRRGPGRGWDDSLRPASERLVGVADRRPAVDNLFRRRDRRAACAPA
ncbi:MAG: hypothetical protein U0736_03630 [Gemmataceae bacterium]